MYVHASHGDTFITIFAIYDLQIARNKYLSTKIGHANLSLEDLPASLDMLDPNS